MGIHYTYERRLTHYELNIHKIWSASLSITTGIDSKLIVGIRNNSNNSTKELVRQSPPKKDAGKSRITASITTSASIQHNTRSSIRRQYIIFFSELILLFLSFPKFYQLIYRALFSIPTKLKKNKIRVSFEQSKSGAWQAILTTML